MCFGNWKGAEDSPALLQSLTQEESEVKPTKTGDAAANKINSTNHRKEWNKLDRIAKNRADTYPTLAKMWNTSTETRNKVLRQFVYSEGVAEKVEATLNWEISTGKKSNKRRAKLTVKQMQSAPHFFAPEKIRKIVSEQEGIPDEVTPHLKKPLATGATSKTPKTITMTAGRGLSLCFCMSVCAWRLALAMFASFAWFDVLGMMCAIMLFRMLPALMHLTCYPKDFLAKSCPG